jgi:hypothetical protein
VSKILSTSRFAKEASKEVHPLAKYADYESYTKSKILPDHRVSTHNYARKSNILSEYPKDVTSEEIDDWLTHVWTKWVMVKSSSIRSDKTKKTGGATPEKKVPEKSTSSRTDSAIHVVKEHVISKSVKGGEEGMNPLIRETLKGWISGGRVGLKELMKFIVDEMEEIETQKGT